MRDLEDDLRGRATDPEQALRVGRMASLEGSPTPTYPGTGRNAYIIEFNVNEPDLMGGSDPVSGPHTAQVRADSRPNNNKARRMVTEVSGWRDLHPRNVEIINVRHR